MSISNKQYPGSVLLKRLIREHIWRYRRKLGLAAICMIIAAAATASNAYMMQPVLDDIFIHKDKQKLIVIPLIVIAIAVSGGMANFGQTLMMRYTGQRIIADLQITLFRHLMRADLGLFHSQASGRLISRFTNDIQMMRMAVSSTLTSVAKELFTMIFLIGVMIHQSIELTLIVALVFPLAIYPIMRLGKRMRKVSNATQEQLGEFTAQLDETFQGVRTVKAYSGENYEAMRAENTINGLFRLYFKAARVQALSAPILELLSAMMIAAIIWYGGSKVLDGSTTPGQFFSFITAFLVAYRPVRSLSGLNTTLQEGLAAANRLFNVLDTEPTISNKPNAKTLQIQRGEIEYHNITFHYGNTKAGVENINLRIPSGKKVALVGLSGGGKSTLMNLLLRFYDVSQGSITVDGQDIRDVTLESLRQNMAFVPQETALFDDSVRANIAYGDMQATEEQLIQAAKDAAAHDFIMQLPQQYETKVGSHGIKLSGGQRQRIAIARAMLKNAPILLMDEATSSLDNESERAVQQALSRLMQGRTTLVIAHRLSTVIGADIIYVLGQGQILEHGTHAELLARRGAYFTLYGEHLVPAA